MLMRMHLGGVDAPRVRGPGAGKLIESSDGLGRPFLPKLCALDATLGAATQSRVVQRQPRSQNVR